MKYRPLGKSGARVSEICLGAMTFGEADEKSFMHKVGSDEEASHAMIDRALDAGVNFVDTADVYGQDGLSERVIGALVREERPPRRVVLATKFRFTHGRRPQPARRESRYRIMRAVEDVAAAPRHRSHRPLPDPHAGHRRRPRRRRCARSTIWCARARSSTSALELRGLSAGREPVGRGSRGHQRLRHAAGAVQPGRARPRARAHPGAAPLRAGPAAVVAARRRLPDRQVPARQNAPPRARASAKQAERFSKRCDTSATGRSSTRSPPPRRRSARRRRRSRSRGCCNGRRSRR